MILFCDTSALMKLYAQEHHSDWARLQVEAAQACIVSQITSALALQFVDQGQLPAAQ